MVKREMIILTLVCMVFLMSAGVSAVSCSSQTFSNSYEIGSIPTSTISVSHCSNSGNLTTVSLSGQGTNYISLDSSSSSINTANEKDIRININQNIPVGNYLLSASFSDGSSPITISISITQQQSSSCSLDIFPTSLTNIKITQGEIKTRFVTLSVPTCFPSEVTVQGISLQTDQKPIQLGELSLGKLQPGQSISIPVDLDATSIAAGQYNDVLQYLLYNSSGNVISVPNTNVGVLVSQGVLPISNFSLTELPSCSLSSTNFNLNQTYSFICVINNPNIKIEPFFNTDYLVGVSDTSTSTQYVYNFKAKKVGSTIFNANFYYDGSNGKSLVGEPFNQSIKITNTGSSLISGTTLDLVFYQDGVKVDKNKLQAKETIIEAVDNQSGNIVDDYEIKIGGVSLQENVLSIISGKVYDIRVIASGFDDLVTNLTASSVSVPYTISPLKSLYNLGEVIEFSSSINNTIYLLNGQIVISPYTLNSEGNFVFTVRNPDYLDSTLNLTVQRSVISLTGDIIWEKGNIIEIDLSKDSNWVVYFTGNKTTKEQINFGTGSKVSFKARKPGLYEVMADGILIDSQTIKGGKLADFADWQKGLFIFIGIIFLVFILSRLGKKKSKDEDLSDIVGAGGG